MHPEPVYSRVDLACEQLDIAIELFFARRSNASALTLAGAAEEILGTELKNRGLRNTLTAKYSVLSRLLKNSKRKMPTWQQFKDDENYARNAAKHIADNSQPGNKYDPFLRGDLRDPTIYMLLRAANNIQMLDLPKSAQVQSLEGWYLADAYPFEPEA